MGNAISAFSGTEQEGKVILSNAKILIASGEVEAALNELSTISDSQQYYIETKKAMADIYLKVLNDRQSYARCYKEIVDAEPALSSFLLLGDAYLNIQEPELSVNVFKTALEVFPREFSLHGKIGKALIKTHNYKRVTTTF
jgi:tetratricopeptide repeat protein 21B